jgi:hypothetical protein
MSLFVKGCNGEEFGGSDYALPAPTMYAYLEHALSRSNLLPFALSLSKGELHFHQPFMVRQAHHERQND